MFLEQIGHVIGHFNPDLHSYDPSAHSSVENGYWYLSMLGHPELLPINGQYNYMMPLVNVWCFFMLLSSVRGRPISKWLFENKTLIKIGKVTYGMYVYHFAVIILFTMVVTKVFKAVGIGNIDIWMQIPLFVVYLTLLYFLSKISFQYIETPFLKLKNKFK